MRTTITLDEDVAAKLRAKVRRLGRPFKEVVNETLRSGLATHTPPPHRDPFVLVTRDLGSLRPGLSLDSTADLIDLTEGPLHR
jgi:hypothetical protein